MTYQNRHFALGREDVVASLTPFIGITTDDGAADGSTLVDRNLIGVNDFISGKRILIGSGPRMFEDAEAGSFNPLTGTITIPPDPLSRPITRGTLYRVYNLNLAQETCILNEIMAEAMLTETGGVVRTDGTEQNVYINDAPEGIFEPRIVSIDFTNQTGAETVVVREYYRMKDGGDWIQEDERSFAGVQAIPKKSVYLQPNRFGVRVTMQRTAGVAQDYDWEVYNEL